MKENVIIKKVDDLGRFVLPKDIRKNLNIRTGDYLELSVENDTLQLKKYSRIQDLEYLVNLIIETIYELYKIDIILLEDKKIIVKREGVQNKRINSLIEEKEYISSKIIFEGKVIGELIILSKVEELKSLLEFMSLFLRKYLE